MRRAKYSILTASALLLLTVALARAGLIWGTGEGALSPGGASALYDALLNSMPSSPDGGFAMISPFDTGGSTGGVPNTSGGAAPDLGANPVENGGTSTGNSGGTSVPPPGAPGAPAVTPEPGTLILTGAGILSALLLSRRKRTAAANSQD